METKPVAARVNGDVAEWLEELADQQATTVGRIVEDKLREAYQNREKSGDSENADPLPEGVYVPDSDKYNYAVKYQENGKARRKYYKTREGAERWAERHRD